MFGIADWLNAYHEDLVALFAPAKGRLPSYSTIRRALLRLDYRQNGFTNMTQAQRKAGCSLNTLKQLFRMK